LAAGGFIWNASLEALAALADCPDEADWNDVAWRIHRGGLNTAASAAGLSQKSHAGQILWSGLAENGTTTYTRQFGGNTFALRNDGREFTGDGNGDKKFTCSAGVRVHADLTGMVLEIIGIDTVRHVISLQTGTTSQTLEVPPKQVWSLSSGTPHLRVTDKPGLAAGLE
jgi:hypothetical protein